MSLMTNYLENKLADYLRGQGSTWLPTNLYFSLGSAGDDATFTELSGTGYARQPLARSLANFAGTQGVGTTLASSGTTHETSNNVAISWGNPGSAWGTANDVGVHDAITGGNVLMVVPISAIVITTGSPNPVQIAAGGLPLSLGAVGGLTDYFCNKLIDLIFRAQAFAMPSPVYLGLYSVAPTNAGGGTELSAGAYARVAITPSLSSLSGTQAAGSTSASSGTTGRISNNNVITFPNPVGADQGTAVHDGMFDASTAGNLLIHAALTNPRSLPAGGPPASFAVNTYGIELR